MGEGSVVEEEEERRCGVCGHEAADADELETHSLSHFGVRYVAKRFKCPHCEGFVAKSVDDLREHIVSTHEKESRFADAVDRLLPQPVNRLRSKQLVT